MHNIGIIGFGRFGQVLFELLKDNFSIAVYDPSNKQPQSTHFASLPQVAKAETLFIAVPIRQFEASIQQVTPLLTAKQTIIDVCSVKVYPCQIMQKYLPAETTIIATHPLFGPDSFQFNNNLRMMMHKLRGRSEPYAFWKNYFQNIPIEILEMTPQQHDQLAAQSQGITHFIGRLLEIFAAEPTIIDTKGYQSLLAVKQQTCNDTWELFTDLQRYNPYSQDTIDKLVSSAIELKAKLF